ncbi:MAG TPA: transmembrane sensor/regulator PpyR, partial [Pseudomonas sp.]|nr:transmembrane sensor/regulator PpyR [Pseudomonas sp.]
MVDFFNNPQNVLHLSHRVLGAGLALLLVGIYGAYLYGGRLPIV